MSIPSAVLGQVFIRRSAAFAGYTFLVYDYLLTLSFEVSYIWDGPWTMVKILFLVHRYLTLIGQTFIMLAETGYPGHHADKFCVAYTLCTPFFIVLSGESVRLLVAMRACAIMGLKRIVAATWYILYTLYAIFILGIVLYFFTHGGPPDFKYLDETGICISPAPPHLWTILFITLVLDSFILFVVHYNLYRMTRGSCGVYPSRLVRVLARDAMLFYMATLFNSVLCIVCWTVYSEDPRNVIQEMISVPFLAVMGQRLVLNIRRLRKRPDSTRDLSRQVDRQMAAMSFEPMDTLPDIGIELVQLGGERAVR